MGRKLPCLTLLLALLAAGSSSAQQAPTRILFIGNSILYWNRMSSWLAELGAEAGVTPPLEVKDETMPLARFSDQLSRDASWSPLGAIRRGGWNIVILQGHPLEPLDDPEGFFRLAARLVQEVRAVAAEPVFFQTYVFPAESEVYRQSWSGGSPAAMLSKIVEAYRQAAEQARALREEAWQVCQPH